MSAEGIPSEWYFITPPQSISWSKDSSVNEIATYGTNNPYLSYGTTKLRSLSLNDALIEGFSDGKTVENNVLGIEACMRMVLEEENGYTSPFCWNVFAGNKSYGTYIITSVNIQEQMRDMGGKATRAKVDIKLTEVPSYQVSSGIDITAQAIQGSADKKYQESLDKLNGSSDSAAAQDKKAQDAKGGSTANGGNPDGGPTKRPTEIDYENPAGNVKVYNQ